jgi:hypothetical protein
VQITNNLRTPLALRQPRPAAIDGNTHDPGLQASLHIPAAQTAEDAQEDLLGDIFCIVPVMEHTNAETENVGLKLIHQSPHRVRVVTQTAPDENCFVSGHCLFQERRSG